MKILDITRLLTVAPLVCLTTLLAACGQQGDSVTTSTPKITPGPNDNLSNSDLLREAVTNTRTLNSYHLDLVESESLKLRISADVQPKEKGRRFQGEKEDGSSSEYLIMTKEGNYVSDDRGKTWYKPEVDIGFSFFMPLVFPLSDTNMQGQDAYISEEFVNNLQIKDGDPPTEIVDGIFTKHMIADITTITDTKKPFNEATMMSFWVSTDLQPLVIQMRLEGPYDSEVGMGPVKYTWKWSRFNEDFGEVKPPPAETIKSP